MRGIRLISALFVLALASACGGDTGFIVRIDIPPRLQVGPDYNKIKVQIDSAGSTFGKPIDVNAASPTPYRVYVYADESKEFAKTRVQVQVLKDTSIVLDKILTDQVFESGELKEIVVAFD